jgi:hypothetical protein
MIASLLSILLLLTRGARKDSIAILVVVLMNYNTIAAAGMPERMTIAARLEVPSFVSFGLVSPC